MKKLLLSLVLLPLFSFVADEWVTVKLDDHVSIDFPSPPQNSSYQGNTVWVQDMDSVARCMALVVDLGKFGMDSAQMAIEMEKPENFEQFRESMMGKMAGAKMISEKKTLTHGLTTYEFVVNMEKVNDGTMTRMFSRNIFYGTKMFSLSFYEKKAGPQEALKDKFINSFRLH